MDRKQINFAIKSIGLLTEKILEESNRLKSLTKMTETLLNQSRTLNDEDFNKFLHNLEQLKKYQIQLRRKSDPQILEDIKDYLY